MPFRNIDYSRGLLRETTRFTILGLCIPDVPVRSIPPGGCSDRRRADRQVPFPAAQVGYFYGHRHRVDDLLLLPADQL